VPFNQPVTLPGDTLARDGTINDKAKAFAVEVINNTQDADQRLPSLITHKGHRQSQGSNAD